MKCIVAAANPDGIEITMTITMTLGEWKVIKKQLVQSNWAMNDPSSDS